MVVHAVQGSSAMAASAPAAQDNCDHPALHHLLAALSALPTSMPGNAALHVQAKRLAQEDTAAAATQRQPRDYERYAEPARERWDVESVLSLRSNLDNHPASIAEPQSGRRPRQQVDRLISALGLIAFMLEPSCSSFNDTPCMWLPTCVQPWPFLTETSAVRRCWEPRQMGSFRWGAMASPCRSRTAAQGWRAAAEESAACGICLKTAATTAATAARTAPR